MYKVIIADDEPLLRFAVQNLIHWEEYGFEVMGEAGDGMEALKLARELNPDLIFTDIRMPRMDGLEMVRRLKRECKASVIILSNYDDFSYAQEALRLGVSDYILKTALTEDQLEGILKRERGKLEQEKKDRMWSMAEERETDSLSELLKKLVADNGDTEGLKEEELRKLAVLGEAYYVILVSDTDSLFRNGRREDSASTSTAGQFLENLIGEKLHGKGCHVLIPNTGCMTVLSRREFDELGGVRLWQSVTNLLERYTNCRYLAGISSCGQGVQTFFDTYQESAAACDRYFFDEERKVILFQDADRQSADGLRGLIENFFEQSTDAAWYFEMPKTIRSMVEEMEKTRLLSSVCKTILGNVLLFYGLKFAGEQQGQMSELNRKLTEKLQNAASYKEMKAETERLLEQMEEHIEEKGAYSLAVSQTVQWIKDHYKEKITLGMAAEQMAIHPNHLSRIFSQQIGRTFSAYLNEYRMEKAKVFLLDRTLSIQEIAEKVGMPNGKYFGDAFKKWCGVSPREYRNRALKEKS